MTTTFEIVDRIKKLVRQRYTSEREVYTALGRIGLQSGYCLLLINANTPNDHEKTQKILEAAKEVLNVKDI